MKEILARITGDDNEALAAKIARKAISALEGQVAALNAKLVDDENLVEDRQEALEKAIYPSEMITDNRAYCSNIARCQESLDHAKKQVETTKESTAYFLDLLSKA